MPDETIDLTAVWSRSLDGLSEGSLAPQHRAWIRLTRPLVLVEDTAVLAAPNDFAKEVLETRLRPLISQALSRELGRDVRIAVTVEASPPPQAESDLAEAGPEDAAYGGPAQGGGREGDDSSPQGGSPFTPSGQENPFGPAGSDPHAGSGAWGSFEERRRQMGGPRGFDAPEEPPYRPGGPGAVPTGEPTGAATGPPHPHQVGARDPETESEGAGVNARTALQPADDEPDLEELESDPQPEPSPGLRPTPASGSVPNGTRSVVEPARLNPKYLFETFVIGSSNRFAHAAAVAVAEAPAKAYNPLFIYGGSGLGKTHLLHAIGHYAQNLYDGARVRYVSSEEFTNDFINSIRDDKASAFQRRYRDVDVLLVDDIQFLENKERTQEEFFHTFNTLHNANKQIVISSDRPPKQLSTLEDRLRNRFEWGLITDVQPPELETRIAILRKKAATERLAAPPEVLEYIASKIATNIRELEGALIRVTAFASLNRQPVDLALAELVLKDLIPEREGPEITAPTIMAQTAAYYGLSMEDLCGTSRSRVLVTARQVAMYLCRELTEMSLPKIGQQFGGRDHTTVMHADRKIRSLMAERRSIYNQVTELTNRIKSQARGQ